MHWEALGQEGAAKRRTRNGGEEEQKGEGGRMGGEEGERRHARRRERGTWGRGMRERAGRREEEHHWDQNVMQSPQLGDPHMAPSQWGSARVSKRWFFWAAA